MLYKVLCVISVIIIVLLFIKKHTNKLDLEYMAVSTALVLIRFITLGNMNLKYL